MLLDGFYRIGRACGGKPARRRGQGGNAGAVKVDGAEQEGCQDFPHGLPRALFPFGGMGLSVVCAHRESFSAMCVRAVFILFSGVKDYKPNIDKKVSTPFAPLSKLFAILSELGKAYVLMLFAPPWAI